MQRIIVLVSLTLTFLLTSSLTSVAQEKSRRKRVEIEKQALKEQYERTKRDHARLQERDKKAADRKEAAIEEELEAWAERHAKSWEAWAEQFEGRMEKLADKTEKEMEEWAEKYSKNWEQWAEDIEGGIDKDKLKALMKNNLKLLSDLPIASLTKQLGELSEDMDDLPMESLGELNDLLAGSIEQSLKELESSLKDGDAARMIEDAAGESRVVLAESIRNLQEALRAKNKRQSRDAERKIDELNKLLKNRDFESIEELEELLNKFQEKRDRDQSSRKRTMETETARAMMNKFMAEKKALAEKLAVVQDKMSSVDDDRDKRVLEMQARDIMAQLEVQEAKQMQIRQKMDMYRLQRADLERAVAEKARLAEMARLQQDRAAVEADSVQRAEAARRAVEQARKWAVEAEKMAREKQAKALEAAKAATKKRSKATAENIYKDLVTRTKRLEVKESEIESMRHEIEQLRKELQKLRDKKDDN
ncbi:MAG: hypothetical protein AAFN77_09785 [Planctomycetota bacterium]